MNPMKQHREPTPLFDASPYIRLYADRSAVIEEPGTLSYFDDGTVEITTRRRRVQITGHDLAVVCLSGGALAVTGRIDCVSFERIR